MKKLWNMKVTIVPIVIGAFVIIINGTDMIIKGTGGLEIWQRTNGDHPNDSIIENGQNTEKSPGDVRRLAVTQSPGINHRLTLMGKTLKE